MIHITFTEYLHEIILVDDHSELTSLEYTFPKALKLLFPPKVKLIRNRRREGLIRTRLVGAAQATGMKFWLKFRSREELVSQSQ